MPMAMKFANSVSVALPRTIAPARRSFRVMNASLGGIEPSSATRACRRRHVVGVDVVLEQHGDPEERAVRFSVPVAPRAIERAGLPRGVGIDVDERVDLIFVLVDASHVHLDELLRSDEPLFQRILQLVDGRLDEVQRAAWAAVTAVAIVVGRTQRIREKRKSENEREALH